MKNNILITDSGKKVTFPYEIKEYDICGKYYIILLDYATDRTQRNVYAINFEGEIIWQIEPISIIYPVLANKCFYVGFRFDNDNQELKAFNWCDYSCIIDIDTGKIKQAIYTK